MNYLTTHLPISISISLSLFILPYAYTLSFFCIHHLFIHQLKKTSFLPYEVSGNKMLMVFLELKFYAVQLKPLRDMYRCIKLWIINEKNHFDFTSFPREKTSGDYAALASSGLVVTF